MRHSLICILGFAVQVIYCQNNYELKPSSFDWPRFSTASQDNFTEEMLKDKIESGKKWMIYLVADDVVQGGRFMQKYLVKGRNRSNLFLVDPLDESKTYGAVDIRNVVPWSRSVIDDRTGYKIKYLPVYRPGDQSSSVTFYRSPSRDPGNENFSIKAFEGFWYLYLRRGEWSLLGKSSEMNDGQPDSENFGWIETRRLEKWDQRLVLQPNLDPEAISQRETEGNWPILGFYQRSQVIEFINNPSKASAEPTLFSLEAQRDFNQEFGDEKIRWPILNATLDEISDTAQNQGYYQVGIIGSPDRRNANSVTPKFDFDRKDLERLQASVQSIRQKSRNVDVVFVIDATKSMGPNIDAVKNTMTRLVNRLLKDKQNTFRFGVVLYTDLSEKFANRVLPLTNERNLHQFDKFLNENGEYHVLDSTLEEGVIQGIIDGIDQFTDIKHGNFIVHVGDAGANDLNLKDTLLSQLEKYSVNLLSIQVRNNVSSKTGKPLLAYQSMSVQMRDIINDYRNILSNKLSELPPDIYEKIYPKNGNSSNSPLIYDSRSSSLDYSTFGLDITQHFTISQVTVSHPGKKIDTDQMVELLNKTIISIENQWNRFLNTVNASSAKDAKNQTFKPGIANYLINTAEFNNQDLQTWIDSEEEAFIPVFVPLKAPDPSSGLKPLLEFALFIDEDEQIRIERSIERLTNLDPEGKNLSSQLIKTLRVLAEAYVDETEADKVELSDLFDKIIGIPYGFNTIMDDIKKEIRDGFGGRENVKIEDLVELPLPRQKSILRLIRTLFNRLFFPEEDFPTFRSYDQDYYWIPLRAFKSE